LVLLGADPSAALVQVPVLIPVLALAAVSATPSAARASPIIAP
jgi:hypothetical protein